MYRGAMTRWHKRRYWIYAALLGLIALDIALYAAWLRTPLAKETAGVGHIVLLQREVSALSQEVARLRVVREHLPELGPQIKTFSADRLLSSATGFSEIAEDLEEAAGDTGVALRRINYKVETVEALPDISRIEVSTSVEGSYARLLRYVEALEQSPRLYIIEDVEVAGTARQQLRLEMRVSAYRNQGA
jgi:Tfp pilus assembly protein PilO